MILYPAIDLKDGACVRLVKGAMASATVFNPDPAAQAREWERAGFRWLHVVDLNGAFEGRGANAEAVEAILKATALPVQLGGGIRSRAAIDAWLERGVARVILGTTALRDPDLVKRAAHDLPGRIVVGIDAKNGRVAVEGWAQESDMPAVDLARRFEDAGVAAIIFTDVSRDGTGQGLNLPATLSLAEGVSIPVIASGGLAGLDDLRRAKAAGPKIAGVICGRALYDGRLDPSTALKIASA